MRPTTASASKTHDKPASPPRKAAGKAPTSVLQRGKDKVEEVAAKAKAAVTNGHHDDEHHDDEEAIKASSLPDHESANVDEPVGVATPVQDVDSSTAELQTPHFEGETLR